MSLIDDILKIQNGAKSLTWGHTRHSDTETLFAVGHKSYHQLRYFIVGDDFSVYDVSGNARVFVIQCTNEDEVMSVVIEMLKQWFPAKELKKCGNA